MHLKSIDDLSVENKTVFLRLDLNVPLSEGVIQDDTRIRAALPTIRALRERGAKIVAASHLGRPKSPADTKYSLEPVGRALSELLEDEIVFVADYVENPLGPVLKTLKPGAVVLLENLRFHEGEKKGNPIFANQLADGLDFYVNDAFGTSHRADASMVAVAERFAHDHRAAGYLVHQEVRCLEKLMNDPSAPFTVIMGGAKVSDKIGVILNLIPKCNNLVIGGAMAYTFLAYQGVKIGSSMFEKDSLALIERIYENAEKRRVKIHLPVDHMCASSFADTKSPIEVRSEDIPDGLMGLDIGPKTIEKYAALIKGSKKIFWNGPMGVFEWESFSKGTFGIAQAVALCPGYTVVGGGDSVSALNKSHCAEKVSHVSTGGGASLEFLEGKVLPGLRVLQS